ncbi:hypothetical protein Ahos_1913 [Acidianus hospitalis W1]|uniref:Uncharacterized protein n=1 Tax=Acidianus hospitalis (strain W1) TaxID=933801 RepID=F4B7N9_ACIHW|nr:hypothetical protein Ahos_1913 [Acidianus hospitalis W1]
MLLPQSSWRGASLASLFLICEPFKAYMKMNLYVIKFKALNSSLCFLFSIKPSFSRYLPLSTILLNP